jgi:superfamily II DNA or RNA helicase
MVANPSQLFGDEGTTDGGSNVEPYNLRRNMLPTQLQLLASPEHIQHGEPEEDADTPDCFDDEEVDANDTRYLDRNTPKLIAPEDVKPPAGWTLLPYQSLTIADASNAFTIEGLRDVRVILPTGTGKTITFAAFTYLLERQGKTVLIVFHRDDLLRQAERTLNAMGIYPLTEKADVSALVDFGGKYRVVLAMIQTLHKKRVKQWERNAFDYMICDECFPAGTLVDGKPIESIHVGDVVRSFNHKTGRIEKRRVARRFKNPAKSLVRVNLANGKSMVCTPDHPFAALVDNEIAYVPACELAGHIAMQETPHDNIYLHLMQDGLSATLDKEARSVPQVSPPCSLSKTRNCAAQDVRGVQLSVSTERVEFQANTDMLGGVSSEAGGTAQAGQFCNPALPELQSPSDNIGPDKAETRPKGYRLLLRFLQRRLSEASAFRDNGANQSQVCVRTNDTQQSDVETGELSQATQGNGGACVEAYCAGREWESDGTTEETRRGTGLADGSSSKDRHQTRRYFGPSKLLQNRRSQRETQDSNRSGWGFTPDTAWERARCPQDSILAGVRVDSVEVLEFGSQPGFERLCADGFVYNIEVEGNHNYFVDGILVHNCHHIKPGNHWHKVRRYFNTAKHLGFTATPGEMRGKKYVNIPLFQRDIEHLKLGEAIEKNYLCRLLIKRCDTKIDLRKVGRVAGDFNQTELDRVIYENTNKLATAIKKEIENRPTIAFTPLVESAEALAAALNDIGVTARAVSYKTRDPLELYEAHKRGEFQVLTNAMKLTEGFDAPYVEAVVIARPTRSVNVYRQMIGRGTRKSEQTGKTNCKIIDFAFVSDSLEIAGAPETVLDVVDENDIKDIADEVNRLIAEGEDVDLMEAMKEAQRKLREKREKAAAEAEVRRLAEEARLAALEARRAKNREENFNYKVTTYDPFANNLLGIPQERADAWTTHDPATDKQKALITKLTKGKVKVDKLNKQAAASMIGQLKASLNEGLATYAQRDLMVRRMGVKADDARNMTIAEATAYINENKTW